MQRLTVIIGKEKEGKSTDMFLEYISHFIGEYVDDNNATMKLRDALKPVFIIGEFNGLDAKEEFDKLISSLSEEDFNPEQWDEITTGIHIMYGVSSKDEIEDIIKDKLEDMDCIFYIDNCDEIVTVEQAANWLSEYSSEDDYHNLDLVMTKQK